MVLHYEDTIFTIILVHSLSVIPNISGWKVEPSRGPTDFANLLQDEERQLQEKNKFINTNMSNSKKPSSSYRKNKRPMAYKHFNNIRNQCVSDMEGCTPIANPLIQFGEMTNMDTVPYLGVSVTLFFDHVNKGTTDATPWKTIGVNPYGLPTLVEKSGDLGVIFKHSDLYVLPKWTSSSIEGKEGIGHTTDTFMVLAGLPARTSGIDKRADVLTYDTGLFQPHRRVVPCSAVMNFRHVAHFDYTQLQRNQQQMSQDETTTSPSAILCALSVISPVTGSSMISDADIIVRFMMKFTYLAPIWMRGITQMLFRNVADPTSEAGASEKLAFTQKTIFPEVTGVKKVD
jgi:hypothetical protein